MAKTKTPFFSLSSSGTIGSTLTTQKKGSATLVRTKPTPTYRQTLPQMYQRWLYEDYAYLWTIQSAATQAIYRTLGVRWHLTAFQCWMKFKLTTRPDIEGWWTLDDISGTSFIDRSRKEYNLTNFGASQTTAPIDKGLYFTTNDYLIGSANISSGCTADITIEFWLKMTSQITRAGIIWKTSDIRIYNYFNVPYRLDIRFNDIDGGESRYTTYADPTAVDWHHYRISSAKNQPIVLYKDNIAFGSQDGANRTKNLRHTTSAFYLGLNLTDTQYLTGSIDNVIIYNRILDSTEGLRHSERRYPL